MLKEIKIEVTDLCSRNCYHCSSDTTDLKKDCKQLSLEVVKSLLSQAAEMGATSAVFTGGEPTVWPYLEEAVEYAKTVCGFNTKLYTMCIRNDKNFVLLNKLNVVGLDEVVYSTASELVENEDMTEMSLVNFVALLCKNTNLKIGFHHVVTRDTLENIEEICEVTYNSVNEKNRLGKLAFLRYVPHGRGCKDLLLSKQELNQLRARISQMDQKYTDYVKKGSPHNILGLGYSPCIAADETMTVGVDGNVFPCDAMKYFNSIGLGGNIYKRNLKEIYDSLYFAKIRKIKVYSSDICKKCSKYSLCKGGCLAQKMIVDFGDDSNRTAYWYQLNAIRTMNYFPKEKMLLNAIWGLKGETGELTDCIKKIITHDLNDDKIILTKKIMEDEIGDIIWYIAASLSTHFDISMNEIVGYLFKGNIFQQWQGIIGSKEKRTVIGGNLIKYYATLPDPYCLIKDNNYQYSITEIDELVLENSREFDLYKTWNQMDNLVHSLKKTNNRRRLIKKSAKLIFILAELSNNYLDKSLDKVLFDNIKRLRKIYPTGYDTGMANDRIDIKARQTLECTQAVPEPYQRTK